MHLEAISIHAVITLPLSAFIAENNGLAETEAHTYMPFPYQLKPTCMTAAQTTQRNCRELFFWEIEERSLGTHPLRIKIRLSQRRLRREDPLLKNFLIQIFLIPHRFSRSSKSGLILMASCFRRSYALEARPQQIVFHHQSESILPLQCCHDSEFSFQRRRRKYFFRLIQCHPKN